MLGLGGKLPPDILEKLIFNRVGVRDPSVLIGPSIGEDAAVIDIGNNKVLVAHVDPITGAIENIGWLAVHIACNDIAVRGVRPRWLLPVLYLPEDIDVSFIDKITAQIDEASREVGAMVVGGHSEYTPGLNRPLISMTALGIAERSRYVTTSGACIGDAVIMTKTVAVEGTAIISTDFSDILQKLGVSRDIIERGRSFIKMISVVKEALTLAEKSLATAMHDPTEGGVLGGLIEVAYASRKTIEVWENRIPIADETKAIAKALGIDPLKLISSGVLIATVPWNKAGEAIETLNSKDIKATVIGRVTEFIDSYVLLHRKSGVIEKYSNIYVKDELNTVWEKWGKFK